jgi:microcystin-dependent protein
VADSYLGQIILFAGDFAPQGFALCDGQLLQISQNTALFSILGTTFGGDGRTTFGVPDLRGRAPMHWGNGPGLTPRSHGQAGGVNEVALTEAQNGVHTHPMRAGALGTTNAPAADVGIANAVLYAPPSSPEVTMHAFSVEDSGASEPHENRQPHLAVNFAIAVIGTFPQPN